MSTDRTRAYYRRLADVIATGERTFFVHHGEHHSYADLARGVRRLCARLEGRRGERIVLYAETSFETYCGLFGILLSGNTWVPMNPTHPEARCRSALDLAAPRLILADAPLPESLAAYTREKAVPVMDLSGAVNDGPEAPVPDVPFEDDGIAYIMFTSGSTGVPKGVPMTHGNYIPFVENMLNMLALGTGEVFSDYHDLGFDISIFYLFCAVLTESALRPFLREEERFFPLEAIREDGITIWSSVPSALLGTMRLRPHDVVETPLKVMFLCGEPLRLDVVGYCYDNLGAERVFNFYGLTETGVENFGHFCRRDDAERYRQRGFAPIGKPLPGNEVRVGDDGELLLSGPQITPGYLGGVGGDRFVESDGKRWFLSGDIVEVDGDVYFCKGRLDSQIKLAGYRIELMDIETHVRLFPGISDAVCLKDGEAGKEHLVCVAEAQGEIDDKALRAALRDVLPAYMVPSRYHVLADFPRNKNGKVDRKAVREAYLGRGG